MPSPTDAVSAMAKESKIDLPSGVKIRLYRNEPFKFMAEINKWLQDLNIGEIQALHMSTDANGWVNYTVAYREKGPDVQRPDPVMVLYDALSVLKDVTEIVEHMQDKLLSQDKLLAKEPVSAA